MKRSMKIMMGTASTTILALIFSINSISQVDEKPAEQNKIKTDNEERVFDANAERWAIILSNKIFLDASQRDSIKIVMKDYQKQRAALNVSSETISITAVRNIFNRRIENYLDTGQISRFKNYQKAWWEDVDSGLNESEEEMNDQNDINKNGNNDKKLKNRRELDFSQPNRA